MTDGIVAQHRTRQKHGGLLSYLSICAASLGLVSVPCLLLSISALRCTRVCLQDCQECPVFLILMGCELRGALSKLALAVRVAHVGL